MQLLTESLKEAISYPTWVQSTPATRYGKCDLCGVQEEETSKKSV